MTIPKRNKPAPPINSIQSTQPTNSKNDLGRVCPRLPDCERVGGGKGCARRRVGWRARRHPSRRPPPWPAPGKLGGGGARRRCAGGVRRRSRSEGGGAETAGRNGGARGRRACPTNFDMRLTTYTGLGSWIVWTGFGYKSDRTKKWLA